MGMFWEMHDLLFENNTHLSEELIYDFAERLELDLYTFKVDMMTDEFKQRIQDDYRGGVKSGVKNTPTFFINGVRYTGENKKANTAKPRFTFTTRMMINISKLCRLINGVRPTIMPRINPAASWFGVASDARAFISFAIYLSISIIEIT